MLHRVTTADRSFVHIFFLDGVGLGGPDAAANPFAAARLPNLTSLLGGLVSGRRGPIVGPRASLVPTGRHRWACPAGRKAPPARRLSSPGATCPQLVGEHYGPKPNGPVADVIRAGTLFSEVVAAGGTAALITPYPAGYFAAVASGKRLLSAVPLAATAAGLALMTADDLRAGRAVSPDFTAQGWRDHLGYSDVPVLSPDEAGRRIAAIATSYEFSFFEHWPTDQSRASWPVR
ncbi:MAG: hypothetical protein IPH95_00155 [Candidatus Promineofilum sp.]|nr:hypothetical protein [Promineifilum sp.]